MRVRDIKDIISLMLGRELTANVDQFITTVLLLYAHSPSIVLLCIRGIGVGRWSLNNQLITDLFDAGSTNLRWHILVSMPPQGITPDVFYHIFTTLYPMAGRVDERLLLVSCLRGYLEGQPLQAIRYRKYLSKLSKFKNSDIAKHIERIRAIMAANGEA